jgi:hypothetical protein
MNTKTDHIDLHILLLVPEGIDKIQCSHALQVDSVASCLVPF